MEKTGQVFFYYCLAYDLGKVKEPPFYTSVTLCKLKKLNKYKLLYPLSALKMYSSMAADEEDKFQTLGFIA